MRITWVVYGRLDQPTGGYVYDRLIVAGLRRAFDDVAVLSLQPGAGGRELVNLDREPPDVVVIDALCIPDVAARLAAVRGPALVLLVHHLTSWEVEVRGREAYHRAEAQCLARCHSIVTTSFATAARIEGTSPGHHCVAVPPGADRLPLVVRPEALPGRLRLLLVGSLIPRKRVLEVLAALDTCATDAFELRLVGDATRDPAYAAQVQVVIATSPRLAARVRCCGVVSDSELAGELARADLLVLASSLEGYGMVLSEARRAGVPQLVARSAALPEIVGAGRDSIQFDDAAHLARLVAELALDDDRRSELRAAARVSAATMPTWSEAARAFRHVLAQAVTSLRDGAPPPCREAGR